MVRTSGFRGWLGLLCGAASLGIAGTCLAIAVRSGSFFPTVALDLESLAAFLLLALAFQYVVPVLAVVATYCSLVAPGSWSGRLGLCLALSALLVYLLFLRACYSALTASSG